MLPCSAKLILMSFIPDTFRTSCSNRLFKNLLSIYNLYSLPSEGIEKLLPETYYIQNKREYGIPGFAIKNYYVLKKVKAILSLVNVIHTKI
jgi:hypothetical protein